MPGNGVQTRQAQEKSDELHDRIDVEALEETERWERRNHNL